MLTSLAFWKAAGDRAARTFAQTLLALLTASSPVLDVIHVQWPGVLSIAAGAALLSVLTSLLGLGDTPAAVARAGRHEAVGQ